MFQNGSLWLRVDFHLHTKADREFVYSGADNDFVKDYVNKLSEQNIQLGIITNHNKFERNEFAALKKKAAEHAIGLFPGVEFSLKEGIHILIAFDEAWHKGRTDYINEFLGAAFLGVSNPAIPPYPNSLFDLQETTEKLDAIGYDYFIIPDGIESISQGRITFLKIGDFNFEALSYTLIDHPNRLCSKDKPKISNSYVKSIFIQGGLLNGKQIFFSAELNNLIGIRGSGKSAILEILRYTLNIPFGAQAVDKEYKDDLIKYVLKSGGKAVVEIVNRQGETYRIERIYGQKEDIYKDDALQQGVTLDAILRQPVYFGQKDLSNKNADFENDLINKLVGGKLNDLQEKIDNQKREILKIVNELNGLSNLSKLKKETETAKANAEYKLRTFIEKGIAEKLQQQTAFESEMSWLQDYKSNIANYTIDLQSIIQNYKNHLTIPVRFAVNIAANTEIVAEANNLIGKAKADFDQLDVILANSQRIDADFWVLIDKLSLKKEELKEEFAKIKREINIPELNPDDFIAINRELETSKLKLIEIAKSEERRIEFGKQLDVAITRLNDLWHERFVLLQGEIGKINEAGGKLSIEIVYKGRKDKFRDKLQDVFKGSGLRENTYDEVAALYADFIDMFKDEFRKLSDPLTETQFVGFKDRFNSALYDVLTYMVENRIIIKFDGKPLREHSLGQRASALILFLLSQKENDILIIDQPEDDLDNQTIYEDVIREIKRLKGRMQFIFATHNANIPVLGDSEMVVSCKNVPDMEIVVEAGSIDCRNIQEKIIKIMEGGKEAFDMRKNIYKIWKAGKI
jgi:ABC-type cobalamin/Fe3+-siderophores transport system ATPase subunit